MGLSKDPGDLPVILLIHPEMGRMVDLHKLGQEAQDDGYGFGQSVPDETIPF